VSPICGDNIHQAAAGTQPKGHECGGFGGLRIDLLFDFPLPAATLAEHATRTKIRARVFAIASETDLLRLKQIARAARSAPGDAEDIAFLEARRPAP
jgi:hypothetical protein